MLANRGGGGSERGGPGHFGPGFLKAVKQMKVEGKRGKAIVAV